MFATMIGVLASLSATKRNSVERDTTTSVLFPFSSSDVMVLTSSISTIPSLLAVMEGFTETFPAVPPWWKVLSVSCVPGSPIDCAAITPTASPM